MPVIIDTILLNSLHQRGVPKARYPINPAQTCCVGWKITNPVCVLKARYICFNVAYLRHAGVE